MKRFLFGVAFAAVLLSAHNNHVPKPREPQKIGRPAGLEEAVNETIKIAPFNIRIFGKSEREKEDVMQVLEKIVRNFDIVAIQELRDKSEMTLPYFVDRINALGDKDVIVLGDFNADGGYFSETTATGLRDSRYLWIVPDDFDTTVAKGNYTYDRIVVKKQSTEEDLYQ